MAGTGSSGKYDWSQPAEPSRMEKWLATHRLAARAALVLIDVVLVVLVITNLDSDGRQWPAFVVLASWLVLTVNFGWVMPKHVDAWRRRDVETG